MKFRRLALSNVKCFGEVDLGLEAGVTVIHGVNGSGKSSLLEACFFALYGAPALDRTLEEVVTIGEDEATVELWFVHANEEYHIRRRIRVREAGAKTVDAVLEGPSGTVEGARDVQTRVTSLLRMDAEAFLNCAYVRQGEVNKLIEASPAERQGMLDELLQLGTLEDYRDRASDARVGVGRVHEGKRELLADLEDRITAKEDEDLQGRRNTLQTELAEISEKIERYEAQRETAVETREEAAAVLAEHEEKRAELEALEDEIAELRTAIAETERERDELADEMESLQDERETVHEHRDDLLADTELTEADEPAIAERRDALETEREDLREDITELSVEKQEAESEAATLRETAADLDERAADKRAEAAERAESLETERAGLAERRDELATLDSDIETIREAFADAPVDVGAAAELREERREALAEHREAMTELRTTIENEREALESAQSLKAEGKCPTCGQDVEDSPHVDAIAEHEATIAELEDDLAAAESRLETLEADLESAASLAEREEELQRLESERDNLAELLTEREDALTETEARIETLREDADALEAEAVDKREAATAADAAAEEYRERIGERNATLSALGDRLERLDTLAETLERIETIGADIDRLRERREAKAETNEERRERLAEKRERKADLAEAVDESQLDAAREDKQRAEEYIAEVDETLADLAERRDALTSQIGAVTNELEALESLRERRTDLAATVEHLASLYEEAEQLQDLYGTVKAELRRQNVQTLERLVNETFELIYENDAYSRIELDGEYRLTVYQKDGEALSPEQLSGGERALFNLSLRCGIYRLLAEGIDGTAPMPPLILDEPTVYLDAGHVSRLVELIGAMYDMGVEQILVVSHDDELVAAADDLVRVHTDPTTNRSTVEQVRGADTTALVEAD